MVLRSFHLDWKIENGRRVPMDEELYNLVDGYAKAELSGPIELSDVPQCWVVCRVDANERPLEVLSMGAAQMVPHCNVFRTKRGPHASKATAKLWDRMNGHFSDLGYRGQDVLLHLDENEAEEGRCTSWRQWLELAGAKRNTVSIPIR